VSLTVGPISAAEHLAFVQTQRSVSFLQTPAWGRVKTEWRSESLGWYDGRQLVGAGLVLWRPVPRLDRFTLAYLAEGPAIDWTGEIDAWLDPLAGYLKAHGAFAIRLGPPVRTNTWSAAKIKWHEPPLASNIKKAAKEGVEVTVGEGLPGLQPLHEAPRVHEAAGAMSLTVDGRQPSHRSF
jgi:lipid II:glycine glycyltransferase (peptidoglycan interpeptide bridge formation enzyme)